LKVSGESCFVRQAAGRPVSQSALDLPEFRPKASRTRFRNATRHAPLKRNFVANASRWKAWYAYEKCIRIRTYMNYGSKRIARGENERILLFQLVLRSVCERARFRHDYSSYRRRLLSQDFPYCLKKSSRKSRPSPPPPSSPPPPPPPPPPRSFNRAKHTFKEVVQPRRGAQRKICSMYKNKNIFYLIIYILHLI